MPPGVIPVIRAIAAALARARTGVLVIGATYAITVTAGILMAHAGNGMALRFRDALVAKAHRTDPSARANDAGAHVAAAAIDFSRNLFMAAIPETLGGLTIVMPVGLAAYRGWVGGIVSVDGHHQSRLRRLGSAAYYVTVMALQLTAFTLAGGVGVHLGLSFYRRRGPFVGPAWFRLPAPALRDVALLYVLIVPIFALGSAIEFLW
jgi:hypothetical protein